MTGSSRSLWVPHDRTATWGRLGVGVVTLLVGLTWLPSLFGPLGDNHEGRIYGLVALQVSNLWELGWSASAWGTSMAPFGEAYSHHPPAFSLWYVPAWQLPGDSTVWVRVVPYLLGLAFLPVSAIVLVRQGLRWGSVAVAVGLVAATPLYWVYGRIWPALGLVALLAWAVVDLRERRHVSGTRLVVVCALAAFAVAANWFALAAAALLGLWLLAGRGLDRVTVTVGTTMTLAALATFAWVIASPDAVAVLDQFERRTSGGTFTSGEFVARMGRWASELLPWWSLAAVPGALWALVDRRTRALAAGGLVLGLGWIVGFSDGAWVHDYWIVSLAVALLVGLAVLAEAVTDVVLSGRDGVVAGAALAVVAPPLVLLLTGPVPEEYVVDPQQAGVLVMTTPAPAQPAAWVARGIAEPTWVGHAWDLPVEVVATARDAAAVPEDELVLVDLDRVPWVQDPGLLTEQAVAAEGDYVLVTGATLAEAAS